MIHGSNSIGELLLDKWIHWVSLLGIVVRWRLCGLFGIQTNCYEVRGPTRISPCAPPVESYVTKDYRAPAFNSFIEF